MSFDKRSGERGSRIDLGDLSLIRYKSKGNRFEIIVDPEKAWLYKQGESIVLDEIVEGYTVFENFSKGLKASENALDNSFGTENEKEIVKVIIEKGELQVTQEMRKRFLREKIDEIIKFLVKHTVNPKKREPHTPARIEKAMDEAGVRIDRNEPTKEQAIRVLKEISSIIPIKMEIVTIEFTIPPNYTGKVYGALHGEGEILKEEWSNDGSLLVDIQVPAGLQAKLMEEIADKTKGKAQIKITNRSGA